VYRPGGGYGTSTNVDLLKMGWLYVPGVSQTSQGLRVSYIGRAIVRQDGSPGQDNPAVNLYGVHLAGSGDVTIHADLRDIKGTAILRLYSDAPVVQDEFRREPSSLEVALGAGTATVRRWQAYAGGSIYQQAPVETHTASIASNPSPTVAIQRQGSRLTVKVDNQTIYSTNATALLDHAIWFGPSANHSGDSWTLAHLSADLSPGVTTVDTAQAPAVNKVPDGLQTLAQHARPGFIVGAAAALGPLVVDDAYSQRALGGNFGQLTTENVLKWQFIHPQQTVYDFHEADAFVAIAQKNHLAVHGHTLVFGEANPAWVQQLPIATAADKVHVRDVMTDHITQTVGHFKDRIASWDVVNEPLADDVSTTTDGFRQHIWYRALGMNYIATAFAAAHQADPHAKLFINEYGLEADGDRWNTFLQLMTQLKSQGVPIDGVGFQAHVYEAADAIDPAVLRNHIRQLAAIGLVSRISEMDVYNDDGTDRQAQQYAGVFGACMAEQSCVSWSTWGVTDRYDLSLDDHSVLQYGSDFLWDAAAQPTPALAAIKKVVTSSP
jgi:endo-1,4-beta-xylanase